MKVKLLSYTPEPEKVIAIAARLCYSKSGIDDLEKNFTPKKIESFLKKIIELQLKIIFLKIEIVLLEKGMLT